MKKLKKSIPNRSQANAKASKRGASTGNLPSRLINKLGKQSDRALAEEFDVPYSVVRRARRSRNIPVFFIFDWTPERVALLGTKSDREIAKLLRITTNSVFSKRVAMSIEPCHGHSDKAKHDWKKSEVALLGTMPDSKIARRLGVSATSVQAKRNSLGVAPLRGANPRKPWAKKELALLGKQPDTVVAKEIGRGRRHVRAQRELLGIPPFQKQTTLNWTGKLQARLKSSNTNAELAKELGVSEGTVALYRRRFKAKTSRRK